MCSYNVSVVMATQEQLQDVINLLKEQMTMVNNLRSENTQLRAAATGKSRKPDRPIINAGIDDREWALFMDTWTRYKSMIGLSDTDEATVRQELRTACSPEVNKLLFEYVGAQILDVCTEVELLSHVKSVAVKTVHKEVHRMAFNKMSQNHGESVTNYVARLKSKAFLCRFEVACPSCDPSTVSYADEMVAQRLIAGLSNAEYQRKILSEAASLSTLDQKIARLQVLETTEESAVELHNISPSSGAAATQHQREKKKFASSSRTSPREGDSSEKCRWCGRTSHPEGKSLDRINCPARERTCYSCNRKGHLSSVCESSLATPAKSEPTPEELLSTLQSESAVSFSFAGHQDFRLTPKKNGDR